MSTSTRIAAAQLAPVFLNKEQTVQIVCDAIKEASQNGAKLIVFPEAFIPAYPDWIWLIPNSKGAVLNELYTELVQNAISVSDGAVKAIAAQAKKHQINVAVGVNERNSESSNTSLYNSMMFFSDEGTLLGTHRKLIPTSGERLVWSRGDGSSLRSYSTSVGRIGGLICWENFMPLARNAIYESGAQIMLAPTWDKSPNWLQSMQHMAREGGVFVVSVCMALNKSDVPDRYEFKKDYPKDREWINTGNSCIIAPNGTILSGPMEAEKGILYADIDLDDIIKAKRMFDVVGHYSRPDVFLFGLKNKN